MAHAPVAEDSAPGDAASPRQAGFRLPAEWEPHAACWLAWPYRAEEWPSTLRDAQAEHAGIVRAIADAGAERVELLVADEAAASAARRALPDVDVRLRSVAYGDSWTRDTMPLLLTDDEGHVAAVCFRFDGWGGRFRIPGDEDLGQRMAAALDARTWRYPFVLEGGAIEVDGQGTCLTTRTCLLRSRRNPDATERETEALLRDALGVERVLWIEGALPGDHTDGHIDTLARFVAPGVVVCMAPSGPHDRCHALFERIAAELGSMRDARGRRLEVVRLPSPGRVDDAGGRPLPASYCNFYIGNEVVLVPAFGSPHDETARAQLASLFPSRHAVSVPSRALLSGGGAVHCVTCPQPRGSIADPPSARSERRAGQPRAAPREPKRR